MAFITALILKISMLEYVVVILLMAATIAFMYYMVYRYSSRKRYEADPTDPPVLPLTELEMEQILTEAGEEAAMILVNAYNQCNPKRAICGTIDCEGTGNQFYLEFRKKRVFKNEGMQAPNMQPILPAGQPNSEAPGGIETDTDKKEAL